MALFASGAALLAWSPVTPVLTTICFVSLAVSAFLRLRNCVTASHWNAARLVSFYARAGYSVASRDTWQKLWFRLELCCMCGILIFFFFWPELVAFRQVYGIEASREPAGESNHH